MKCSYQEQLVQIMHTCRREINLCLERMGTNLDKKKSGDSVSKQRIQDVAAQLILLSNNSTLFMVFAK